MAEETTIHRATVRLEKPIYDVLIRVALENHLHTPRRGPNITGAIRWLVLDWQRLRAEARGASRNSSEVA
jgi:predicted DNA-binding ribbon-helix-helix protein